VASNLRISERPVKARAKRNAIWQASLPLDVKATSSAQGIRLWICSETRNSNSCCAP
jgi:hypothetical protein